MTSTSSTSAVTALREEARKLTTDERLALVEEILGTIDATDPELDRLWASEAKDRYEAYKRGDIKARPLEDVLAKYDAK